MLSKTVAKCFPSLVTIIRTIWKIQAPSWKRSDFGKWQRFFFFFCQICKKVSCERIFRHPMWLHRTKWRLPLTVKETQLFLNIKMKLLTIIMKIHFCCLVELLGFSRYRTITPASRESFCFTSFLIQNTVLLWLFSLDWSLWLKSLIKWFKQ